MANTKVKTIGLYSAKTSIRAGSELTVDAFIADVKNGRWQDAIIRLRAEKDPAKQDAIKTALPCVTVSGLFTDRTDKSLAAHSGFIAIDIDDQGEGADYASLRDKLGRDPYFYAVFLSCRGKGLCGLVRINPKAHKESYLFMSEYLYNTYGIHTDPSCKNLARLRFVSYDPDLVHNPNAVLCPASPAPKKEQSRLPRYVFDKTDFDRIIEEVVDKKIDLTSTYQDWIYCAMSLLSRFEPEQARAWYHQISEINPEYDYHATEAKFDHLLSTHRGEVPIDWFYRHVERNGIEPYGKAQYDRLMFQAMLPAEERDEEIDPEALREILENAKTLTKLRYYLRARHQNWELDEFSGELTADGKPVTDWDINSLYFDFKEEIDEKLQYNDLVKRLHSDFVKKVHPFKQFISRYEQQSPAIHPSGNIDKIIQALDIDSPYADIFIRKWLVAMVASAFGKPSDLVLVFCGPQGTGKTEWFRRILPPELSKYRASLNWEGGRDEIIRMSRNLIMIDDEMGGKSNKEEKQIKKITSIDSDYVRGAYKQMDEKYNRSAIFCGTTNDEWILSDPTGNRRFLPVYVNKMNHELFNSVDKGLLFYELYLLYTDGFNTELTEDERLKLKELSERFEKPHMEEELVNKYYRLPQSSSEPGVVRRTYTDILQRLRTVAPGMRTIPRELGGALQRAGFKRSSVKVGGRVIKCYLVIEVLPSDEFPESEPIEDILN